MDRPKSGTFIDNLPEHLYHNKRHGFSSSDLKAILKQSPYHFKYRYDQPPGEPTEAMRIGSVLHAHVLRPNEVMDEIAVMPPLQKKSKAQPLTMKQQKEMFVEGHKDRTCVTEKENETGVAMAQAVRNNEEAMRLLEGGINERSLYGEVLGTPLRARPDSYKVRQLNELKSAADGSPSGFSRQIANLQYHVSLVHYLVLMEQAAPEFKDEEEAVLNTECFFIVVENFPPYAVSTYKASEAMIAVAFERWKFAINVLSESVEADFWPAYTPPDATFEIDLPRWAMPQEIEE